MEEKYNPFSLEGKVILITGASSGIGRSTAIMCAKMGATIIATARSEEKLQSLIESLHGNNHKYIVADLTSEADRCLVSDLTPNLDGVVFSAGISIRTLLRQVKEKDIQKVMDINFKAPVILQKELLKKKKINNDSSLVFIASRAPFAPVVGNGIYAASKGALIAYVKVLSLELANKGIRANCICPAMVWTDLIIKDAKFTGANYEELEKQYPLKRYGQPEDIASLSIYLLSDASSWMTGSCLDITGGSIIS